MAPDPIRLRRYLLLGAMLALLLPGCGEKPATTELERDPREDGRELSRWPGWRGLNASGIAPGGSPALQFSSTEGFRWKVAVPGRGSSSPVVWDHRVLLTSALGDSDTPDLVLLCFDRADGRLLWQAEAGAAQGPTHVKNGYASASVATDGQRIFAFFGATGLFCYDFSGVPLWRKDLGPLHHRWGTASSPVLFGQSVIQLCDFDGDSYIAAFDQTTGAQLWRTERPSRECWSTPVLVPSAAAAGQGGPTATPVEMVVNGTSLQSGGVGLIIAYDPRDGRELWRVQGTKEFVTPTALVGSGLVFSTSGRNGPVIAIRPGGAGDVTSSHVVWQLARGGPYVPTGLVYRNRLLLLGDAGDLACYNAGNGESIWTAKLPGAYSASLVAADGRIYAVSEHGTVSVFAAADSFQLLARNELHSKRCYATPAIVDGELIIRTETELYCIPPAAGAAPAQKIAAAMPAAGPAEGATEVPPRNEVKPEPSGDAWPLFRGDPQASGVAAGNLPERLQLLWTFSSAKGGFEATAAIAHGAVFAGDDRGKLYAVELGSGKKRWEFSAEAGFSAAPAVRSGLVYVGDQDGRFYCIDAHSGKQQWKFTAEAEISSSANFYKDAVLFGSQDSRLYCLKADSGELVWKYEAPDQIRCFPSIAGDRTFVAGCDGKLHVIDLGAGKEVSEVDLGGPTGTAPALLGERAFVGIEEGTFLGIDFRHSKVLWRYTSERGGAIRSSAAVTPEVVIVGSRDKSLHALEPKTGRLLWTFATKSRVDSSPVVVGTRVFVGSADGRLYGLDLKTGRELWRFEAGGALVASPAVAAGRLVIGSDSGDLYCLGAKP